jgi:hypothetical protein
MRFNADHVRTNVQQATTEDLLDRLTVYAEEMEPEALEIVEAELRRRGVSTRQIREHAEQRNTLEEGGHTVRCSFCERPAVRRGWGWHRLWGWVPLFPRSYCYCEEHSQGR